MPKYLIHCDTGFCGVNDDVIVESESEAEAEEIASEWWNDTVAASVNVEAEITEENESEYEGYEEI